MIAFQGPSKAICSSSLIDRPCARASCQEANQSVSARPRGPEIFLLYKKKVAGLQVRCSVVPLNSRTASAPCWLVKARGPSPRINCCSCAAAAPLSPFPSLVQLEANFPFSTTLFLSFALIALACRIQQGAAAKCQRLQSGSYALESFPLSDAPSLLSLDPRERLDPAVVWHPSCGPRFVLLQPFSRLCTLLTIRSPAVGGKNHLACAHCLRSCRLHSVESHSLADKGFASTHTVNDSSLRFELPFALGLCIRSLCLSLSRHLSGHSSFGTLL